jgi:uncharacterized UBP type Zn finger protein
MATCAHLDQITITEPSGPVLGCEECLKIAGRWVHLRMCESCGKVGCCDDSPNRHASKHYAETSHPVIRSLEPGESWSWCYVDEVAFVIAGE